MYIKNHGVAKSDIDAIFKTAEDFHSLPQETKMLSAMSRIFLAHGLNLIDARVTTLGARAEDVFVVNGPELEDAARREAIAGELCKTAS